MDTTTDRAKLHNLMRDLRVDWQEIQKVWNDPVSREFEEQYLDELEAKVQAALRGMDRVTQVLLDVRRQCE